MVAEPPKAIPPQRTATSSSVLLQGISWDTYQSLVQELESQPSKRLTYDNGLLEIFMPLPPHEKNKKYLARLVEIITMTLGIEICSLGFCTWNRPDLVKGLEPDECYYIQNGAIIRGKMNIDLAIDLPPDLAIEIDITSLSLPRLPIYAALGIPEVWQFDGEKIVLLALINGQYQEIPVSIALPIVTTVILQDWLTQVKTMGETTWAMAIQRWARETID
ncbi:MAG: Uma2 family endonuclease [Acaryochloris sp. CRU_2_0]|nr:Uma2 family endonuclease [Acaryochloris sp. CRU_2_0]